MKVAVVIHHCAAEGSTVIHRTYRVVPDDRVGNPDRIPINPSLWPLVTIAIALGTIARNQDETSLGRLLDFVTHEIRKSTTLGDECAYSTGEGGVPSLLPPSKSRSTRLSTSLR